MKIEINPARKFVRENDFMQQLKHLKSEVAEVEGSYAVFVCGYAHRRAILGEIADVMHSADTLMRVFLQETYDAMDERYADVVIKEEHDYINHRKQERGYCD